MSRSLAIAFLFASASFASAASAADLDLSTDGSGAGTANSAVGLSLGGVAEAAAADSAGAVMLDEPAPPSDDGASGWDGSISPYLWVAGTSGTIGIPKRDGEVTVDRSFADILANLKFAFMGNFDAHHKGFVILGDVIYLSVGMQAQRVDSPGYLTGKVDASTFLATGALGYRAVDKGPLYLDVFAGGRVISLYSKIQLVGPLMTREAKQTATTVAPVVGARLHAPMSKSWALGIYGDAGGLVKGSDVKWQLIGDVEHSFSSRWSASLGYRYMSINHDNNRFEFNIDLSGPFLAFTYRF